MSYPAMLPLVLYLSAGVIALVVDKLKLIKNQKAMPYMVVLAIILSIPLGLGTENIFTHILMAFAIGLFGLGMGNMIKKYFSDFIRSLIRDEINKG